MMTLKKRQFVDNYKLTKNASEAARLAGYSPKSAGNTAYKLLKDGDISRYLAKWEEDERLAVEAKAIEIKIKCNPTRNSFIERTFLKAETNPHQPTAAKYWEMGGKVMGYLGGENLTQGDTITLNIMSNELHLFVPQKSVQLTQPIVIDTESLNTITERTVRNSIYTKEIQDQCPIISTMLSKENSEVPEGVGSAPRPPLNLSVIPSANSAQILNSVNDTSELTSILPIESAPKLDTSVQFDEQNIELKLNQSELMKNQIDEKGGGLPL